MYFLVNRFPHFLCQVINWMINEPSAAFSIWRMIVTKHCISDPALIGNISNMFYSSEHCLCLTAVTALIGARSAAEWELGCGSETREDARRHKQWTIIIIIMLYPQCDGVGINHSWPSEARLLARCWLQVGWWRGLESADPRLEERNYPSPSQHSFTEDGQWTVPLYLSAPLATKWQILLIWHLLTFITDHLRPFEQIVMQSPKANCQIHFNKLR